MHPTDYDSLLIVDEMDSQRFVDYPVILNLDVAEPQIVTAD